MTVLPEFAACLSDQYRIERVLGEGGMATVYLAEDLRHKRQVAIKVLRPELGAAIGAERFLREIETTASLRHPHILPLFDSGEAAGLLYYVMPLVEGESLRDRMQRERQLTIDDALAITREVADALGYAHARGVVHRDINVGDNRIGIRVPREERRILAVLLTFQRAAVGNNHRRAERYLYASQHMAVLA